MAEGDPDIKIKTKTVDDTKAHTTDVQVPTAQENSEGPSGLGPEWRDWHVVKKAIKGYTNMGGEVAQEWLRSNGGGWAQPDTAFAMGDAFGKLAATLLLVRDMMVTQTNRLFQNWEGPGAKAYGDVVNAASDMLQAQYNAIVAPSGGANMVDLLYHVGNTLLWGQNQITKVETAFAKAAQAAGATVVTSQGSGTVTHISEVPELAEAQNNYFYQIANAVNTAFGNDRQMMGTPSPASDFAANPSSITPTVPDGLNLDDVNGALNNALNDAFPDLNDSLGAPGLTDANGDPISVPELSTGSPPGLGGSPGAPDMTGLGSPSGMPGLSTSPNGLDPAAFDPVTGQPVQVPNPSVEPPPGLTGSGAPGAGLGTGLGSGLGTGPGAGVPMPLAGGLPLGGTTPSANSARRPDAGQAPIRVPQFDVGEPPQIGAAPGAPGIPATELDPVGDAGVPSSSAVPSVGMDGAGNPISVPEVGLDGMPVGGVSPNSTDLGVGGIGSGVGGIGSGVGGVDGVGGVGGIGSVGGVDGVGNTGSTAFGTGSPGGIGGTADGTIPGSAPGSGGTGGSGMPFFPPMMGGMGGMGGQGDRQREDSSVFLEEHRKPWDKGDTDHLVGTSLGRQSGTRETERAQHHLRSHRPLVRHEPVTTATQHSAVVGTAEEQSGTTDQETAVQNG